MYLDHFGLQKKPFEQLPDLDFIFLSEKHESALTNIQFAVAIRDSFVVVTGEIGSGKTTLLHKFFEEELSDAVVAFITHTRLSGSQLLETILAEFGEKPFGKGKVELNYMFRDFVERQNELGKRVVIVVDEVQNLSPGVLEELRLLTCTSPRANWMINVVLVGQPQFNQTLDSPELKQLRQRCRLTYHLSALTREETDRYIVHRIAVGGGDAHAIFESDVFDAIFELTTGIPRLINMLCDTALVLAYVDESDSVSMKDIESAANELGWSKSKLELKSTDKSLKGTAQAAFLRHVDETGPEAVFRLREPNAQLGRAADCNVRVEDKSLSRYHAMFTFRDDGWVLSDLNSTNGTFVNETQVTESLLSDGDQLRFGAAQFVFNEVSENESSLE